MAVATPPVHRLADLLGSLSLVGDLGFGLEPEFGASIEPGGDGAGAAHRARRD